MFVRLSFAIRPNRLHIPAPSTERRSENNENSEHLHFPFIFSLQFNQSMESVHAVALQKASPIERRRFVHIIQVPNAFLFLLLALQSFEFAFLAQLFDSLAFGLLVLFELPTNTHF